MQLSETQSALLAIYSGAMFKKKASCLLPDQQWRAVDEELCRYRTEPLAYLAGNYVTGIPEATLKNWRGLSIACALQNMQKIKEQHSILDLLQSSNIACAILKGSSINVLYPTPDVRSLGDIDILVKIEDYDKAGNLLLASGFHGKTSSTSYHAVYCKSGVQVEIHKDVTNYPDNEAGKATMAFMQEALSNVETSSYNEYDFPVLDCAHQTVALLVHMVRHSVYGGIGFRQLCDWAAFVHKALAVQNFSMMEAVLKQCGLLRYAKVATRVCVLYLGLPEHDCPWCHDVDVSVCEAFLYDVFQNGNNVARTAEQNNTLLFLNKRSVSEKQKGMLLSLYENLAARVKKEHRLCNRFPALIPGFILARQVKLAYQRRVGKLPHKSIHEVFRRGKKKKELFDQLGVYVTENGKH